MQCRICNKVVGDQAIAVHLKIHNKKYQEYVEEFYDKFKDDFKVWRRCEICQKLSKQGNTCSREHGIQLRKIKFPNGTRFGCKNTEEAKQNMSIAQIKRFKKHPSERIGTHHTEETKKLLSKLASDGSRIGKNNGMYGKTHTPAAIKKIFSFRKMNKLEKLVADKLNEAGFIFTFQYFIVENNVCKSYDFKIKGKPIIIEVDGDYWHGNPKSNSKFFKINEVRKNDKLKDEIAKLRGIKVLRFWESDIKANPDIVVNVVNSLMP
jgi:very-short-patch-repair endonuclease